MFENVNTEIEQMFDEAEINNNLTNINNNLTVTEFLTIDNYTTMLNMGNLRGGTIKNIRGVKYGRIITLYVQINGITAGGGDIAIFSFKDTKYYPLTYAVHNAYISTTDNPVYIGQFSDGHFTMAITGTSEISASKPAMLLFTITYICQG